MHYIKSFPAPARNRLIDDRSFTTTRKYHAGARCGACCRDTGDYDPARRTGDLARVCARFRRLAVAPGHCRFCRRSPYPQDHGQCVRGDRPARMAEQPRHRHPHHYRLHDAQLRRSHHLPGIARRLAGGIPDRCQRFPAVWNRGRQGQPLAKDNIYLSNQRARQA